MFILYSFFVFGFLKERKKQCNRSYYHICCIAESFIVFSWNTFSPSAYWSAMGCIFRKFQEIFISWKRKTSAFVIQSGQKTVRFTWLFLDKVKNHWEVFKNSSFKYLNVLKAPVLRAKGAKLRWYRKYLSRCLVRS